MNSTERAQESRQGAASRLYGIMGTENAEGRSAGRTEGASDLPIVRLDELDDMSREGWARAAARPGLIEDDGFITVFPERRP